MTVLNDGSTSTVVRLDNDTRSVPTARRAVFDALSASSADDLAAPAAQVVTELVANAVFHTAGPIELHLDVSHDRVRISVVDSSQLLPVVPTHSTTSMTGRGLLLVTKLASRFGCELVAGGKVVWSELSREPRPEPIDLNALIPAWADAPEEAAPAAPRYRVELGDVPTDLLLAAKYHVDNLVREFCLAAAGAVAGSTASVPPHLVLLIETVVSRFSEARLSIKRQALEAARRGSSHVRLGLDLGLEAADAGEAYLHALDEADAYCRAARFLTLATPPRHRVFRQWYVGEIVRQLRRSAQGLSPEPPQPFEERLLQEIDSMAAARRAAERAARLYRVASRLTGAGSPEEVADAVLREGVVALAASGGGLLLPAGTDRLAVPGTFGYDEVVVENLRSESPAAELPAAAVLRTGEAVWLESGEDRDTRFPDLIDFERGTVSLCAVPLRIGPKLLGALRFSFTEPRLFDPEERNFVMALAAQAAQALARAQLDRDRSELARRLQQTLLPPGLPTIPGLELAAAYHPLGYGIEAGGDFYDVWPLSESEWAFALGDVCGTGPEAAGLAALVRFSLRATALPGVDHEALLQRLNQVLIEARDIGDERFCTVIFGTLKASGYDRYLRLASGGHPPPLWQRANGEVHTLPTGGSLLGVLPSVDIVVNDLALGPGERVVLYTDGVTEARSGTAMFSSAMFGPEGLVRAITGAPRGACATAKVIEEAVLEHSGGRLGDDMAVLVLEALPEG
ncbi:MAG TPA: SpoIIE family protein phosphatase [Acidimicrobiales bacterium]|nr:SpoIIE family protein phosphatase [Acidimicrobiales bacterium]